jgi:hypothetical protein
MVSQIGALFLSHLIVNDLDSDHQSATANIADDLVFVGPLRGFLENIITNLARVFPVFRFDQVKRGQTGGDVSRVSSS